MNEHVQSLFESGDRADCTIKCHEKEYKVHQIIIGSCKFFAKALEHDFKEKKTGIIEMPDDDPVAVHHLLRNIYGFPLSRTKDLTFMDYSRIFAISKKYLSCALARDVAVCVNTTLEKFDVTKEDAVLFQGIALIYNHLSSEDDDMKTALLSLFYRKRVQLTSETHALSLFTLFSECPDLGREIYINNTKLREAEPRQALSYRCTSCGTTVDSTICMIKKNGGVACYRCLRQNGFNMSDFV